MTEIQTRLIDLMTTEYGYAPEDANALVVKHAKIVMNGILAGGRLDPIIMAIQIVEDSGRIATADLPPSDNTPATKGKAKR